MENGLVVRLVSRFCFSLIFVHFNVIPQAFLFKSPAIDWPCEILIVLIYTKPFVEVLSIVYVKMVTL